MERVSDERKVSYVPSIVEVVGGGGEKWWLEDGGGQLPMADGGHLKKRQACYGPPCQQGDRRHHVRCHGLTILVDHENTVRGC